jgi:hypothetical protein
MGASALSGLCCKEGVVNHRHKAMGASPPRGAGTGLSLQFLSPFPGLPVFPLYPLRRKMQPKAVNCINVAAQARNRQPQVVRSLNAAWLSASDAPSLHFRASALAEAVREAQQMPPR